MTTIAEELRALAKDIPVAITHVAVNGSIAPGIASWAKSALTAIAERAEKAPEGLSTALDEYERQTKQLPCQHEIPSRGCCSYNWQMAVIRDLRRMLAAAPEPPKVQP